MKKIICLLLIVACAFAMVSCKKNKKSNATVETISGIVNQSVATKIVTKTEYLIEGEDALIGKYTTEIDRSSGNSRFTFEYSRYASIEEMSNRVKTLKGSIVYDSNGNVSHDEGDSWEPGDATAYLPFELNIDEKRFASVEISEDGTDLTAKIAPSEAKRVFGTEIAADGDITLKVETNGEYLYEIIIEYTAKTSGAKVAIQTSYDYSQISIRVNAPGVEENAPEGDTTEENVPDDGMTEE